MSTNKSRLTVISNVNYNPIDPQASGVSESNSVLTKNLDKFDKVLVIGYTAGYDGNKIDIQHTQNMSLLEVNWLKSTIERYIDSTMHETGSEQT